MPGQLQNSWRPAIKLLLVWTLMVISTCHTNALPLNNPLPLKNSLTASTNHQPIPTIRTSNVGIADTIPTIALEKRDASDTKSRIRSTSPGKNGKPSKIFRKHSKRKFRRFRRMNARPDSPNRRRIAKRISDQKDPLQSSPTHESRVKTFAALAKDIQTDSTRVSNRADESKDLLLADESKDTTTDFLLADGEIDYSNYFYEDLNILAPATSDKQEFARSTPKVDVPADTSTTRRGPRRQQSRQPRRLQSRKISESNNRLGNDIRKDASRISHASNGERRKSKDILREFPIFRKFSEKHTDNIKLSLHERLENHRISENNNDFENKVLTIPVGSNPVVTPKLSTTPELLAIKNEIKVIKLSEEENVTDDINIEDKKVTNNINIKDKNVTNDINIEGKNVTNDINTEDKNVTNDLNIEDNNVTNDFNIKDNNGQTIKTNVTFSTSRSHKVEEIPDPYPDVLSLALLDGQLGNDPLGNAPFGYSPFGDAPLGENPFGDSPQGVAPLGNQSISLVINQTKDANNEKGDPEGRYHVQVTAPNGSINGNYVVVDPVTGDLNGVQYEVAQDVDPTIVQKALLNFLSLVPKRKMDFSEPAQTEARPLAESPPLSKAPPLSEAPPIAVAIATDAAIILDVENTTVDVDPFKS